MADLLSDERLAFIRRAITTNRVASVQLEVELLAHIDALTAKLKRDVAFFKGAFDDAIEHERIVTEPERDAALAQVAAFVKYSEPAIDYLHAFRSLHPEGLTAISAALQLLVNLRANTAAVAAEYRKRTRREDVEAFATYLRTSGVQDIREGLARWLAEQEGKL